jgi:hypothetical protein
MHACNLTYECGYTLLLLLTVGYVTLYVNVMHSIVVYFLLCSVLCMYCCNAGADDVLAAALLL